MRNLYDKYLVTKKNGKTDPNAQYFVLRVDKDPHARVALAAYRDSIKKEDPMFARQIDEWMCSAEKSLFQPHIRFYMLNASVGQMKLLAEGLLENERPFTVREWCGSGKLFSIAQFTNLRKEMIRKEMLEMASEKDPHRGFVLTREGRAVLNDFLMISSV